MMHGPIFNIQLKAEIIFLEKIRSAAKRTHEWFHNLPSDLHRRQAHKPKEMKIFSSSPLAAIHMLNMTETAVPFSGACALQRLAELVEERSVAYSLCVLLYHRGAVFAKYFLTGVNRYRSA